MNKDKYKILKIMAIVTGICTVGFFAVTFAVPSDAFANVKTMRAAFAVTGAVFLCAFSAIFAKVIEYKGAKSKDIAGNKEPSYGDKELNEWLALFKPFVKHAAGLEQTSERTFTKFGGLPTVSKDFEWATFDGKPIPFLLQIDFEEINPDGLVENFPTSGLMYVFVDSDKVNFVHAVIDDDYDYHEGETFKILFFEKTSDLKEAKRPSDVPLYKEMFMTAKIAETYPDPDDSDEAFEIYYNKPCDGMDDAYDHMRYDAVGNHSIGGWATTYIQGGGYVNASNGDGDGDLILLMQIGSESDDEKFMWGDVGNLYFYIRKSDLEARNFRNVKLDMQCT